ncbi:hypothetical protein [Elizabethkingia anophelis]|uniref:hypothetical protein n=1 Tax=Elizabethkingia anophelis TaxID=1117645 RepID=UPI000409975E|nr:hypothetical protein [Elizabethkingia anophelis]
MKLEDKLYKLSSYEFNDENPFLKQAIEEVQKNIVKKYKTASNTNQKAILQAFDPNTGEVLGHTQFIRQIEVDEQQFAKFYLSSFSSFFDLKPPAIKVFGYILNQLIPNKDEFVFLLDDCIKYTGYKTKASVFQGLGQLVQNEIIARGKTDFLYYINPMVTFNGNRVTFAKTYVKKKNIVPKNQGSLDFENPSDPYKLPEIDPLDSF